MTLEEGLRLERYKFVTERQKYFTDLAKETFNSYTTMFAAFAAGAVTFVSLTKQLALASARRFSGLISASLWASAHPSCNASHSPPRHSVTTGPAKRGLDRPGVGTLIGQRKARRVTKSVGVDRSAHGRADALGGTRQDPPTTSWMSRNTRP